MTRRVVTKLLRAEVEAEGQARPDWARRNRRSLGLEGPATVARGARRAQGFRRATRAALVANPRAPKALPHPMAMAGVKGRPISHTNFIRRAEKRNRAKPMTRADILAMLRRQDPRATRGQVSAAKRRIGRSAGLQPAVNAMIEHADRAMAGGWRDPKTPTQATIAPAAAGLVEAGFLSPEAAWPGARQPRQVV